MAGLTAPPESGGTPAWRQCPHELDGDRCELSVGHELPHRVTVHLYGAPTQDPPADWRYRRRDPPVGGDARAAVMPEQCPYPEAGREATVGGRDTDWILAMGHALGLDSGFRVPIIPEVEPLRELFASIRSSALESQAATIATLQREIGRKNAALETIQHWDCLNPPRADLLGDLPWLRRVVEAALADEEPKA